MSRLLLALAVTCSTIAGCGGEPAATLTTPTATTSASGAPSLTIEKPADGSTQPPGDVVIETNIGGFRLVDKPGGAPVVGEGHILFYADVDFIPSDPGRSARTSEGTYRAASTPSTTWPGLATGKHALFAQLVNHDDTPLNPPVTDRVVITISDGAQSSAAPSTAMPAPPASASATASQAPTG